MRPSIAAVIDASKFGERGCAEAARRASAPHFRTMEGIVEHAGVRNLIAELKAMSTNDEFHDPKVTVLSEYITHHRKEEESTTFPAVEDSDLDLVALGERVQASKQKRLGAARKIFPNTVPPRPRAGHDECSFQLHS